MRPRILHILNALRPSGAEVMLRQAAPYWREAGFDLTVLACGPEVGPYAPVLAEASFRIEHLPFLKTLQGMAQLRATLQRLQPDLIHVHSEGMAFFVALANWFSLRRTSLRTIHTNFPFTGFLKQRKRLERVLQRAWGVQHVAIGPSVAENERSRFWNPCVTCPNWFDEAHFRPPIAEEAAQAKVQWDIPPDIPTLVTVGNCSPIKNHGAILEALAHPNLRDRPWIYLHAGHEDAEASERAQAQRLGLASKVRFLGPIQDVRGLLWAADLFVMPSVYEGFSIAAVEAAGTGIPMLLSRVPGLRDLADYDEPSTITWMDHPAPESIVKGLCGGLTFQSDRVTRPWVSRFSIQAGATRYHDLYRSQLAGGIAR